MVVADFCENEGIPVRAVLIYRIALCPSLGEKSGCSTVR